MKNKNLLLTTISALALTVVLGAFGAHTLKKIIDDNAVEIYKTGVQYQFIHLMGIFMILVLRQTFRFNIRSVYFLFFGIVLFSGSLYLISISKTITIPLKIVGPLTPIGGLFFIVGWLILFYDILKNNDK